jgi:hypothetical protein
MPLDSFVEHATYRMEVVGNPKDIQPVQKEVQAEIDKAEGKPWPMGSIERMAFYEVAKKAYCVITTRRDALLRLLRLHQGRDPAEGIAGWPRKREWPFWASSSPTSRSAQAGSRKTARPSSARASRWGQAAKGRTSRSRRRASAAK